jgi:hypothetical protein
MKLQNLIARKQFDEDNKGGVINSRTLLEQIGRMNWLALSGGRYEVFNSTVFLPVSRGYWVAVTLTAADDYTVSRIFIRAGKISVKETFEGVYAENISEVAYRASCYENVA